MLTGLQALTPWHKKDKIIKNKKDEGNFESDKTVEENNFLVLYRPVDDDRPVSPATNNDQSLRLGHLCPYWRT